VARQLAAAGHKVVALVRDPSKAATLAALGAALHKGDLTDKESLRRPMAGVDGVFHIAAWYKIGEGRLEEARTINVQGTRNVLQLMRDLKIPKASSSKKCRVRRRGPGIIFVGPHSFPCPQSG